MNQITNEEFVNELKRRIEFTRIMLEKAKRKNQIKTKYYLAGIYDNLLNLYKYMTGKVYK